MERGHHHPALPLVPGRVQHLLHRQRRRGQSGAGGGPDPDHAGQRHPALAAGRHGRGPLHAALRPGRQQWDHFRLCANRATPPLDNRVIVNKVLKANIGLEHFWQFTSQPVGAGMTHMTNIANGNSLLTFTPWSEPGRGLSTVVRLIYNSREEHSDSPAGNNWSLSISGLTRFGDPPPVPPNNAASIPGRSNKFIKLLDGTGRLLTFQGVTNPDGTTSWFEPPGVHLFLRSVTTDTTNPRFWAITRPDRVTFWYNSAGFPTFVTDKNGNTLSFTLSAVQPGDDPGGPKFHVTQVTDA